MTQVQNVVFGNVYTGERAGSATAVQLASQSCRLAMFIAPNGNAGDVYLGGGSDVTVAAGTTTATAGYELQPGGQTPWIPISNVDLIWIICDNAGDDLLWMALE